jgi:uncharacterized protein (DUF58 family)
MSLTRHANVFAKLTALWVGLAAAATSITGGALLALAAAIWFAGNALLQKARRKQRAERAELIGTAALILRLASTLIRRDPKKAVILALFAGAVAEFLMGETQP